MSATTTTVQADRKTLYEIALHNERTLRHSCTVLQNNQFYLVDALRDLVRLAKSPPGGVTVSMKRDAIERAEAALARIHS